MAKKKRMVLRVVPYMDDWAIVVVGSPKATAVSAARSAAKVAHENGVNSQVVVHRKDGRIQTEYTFGSDPKRRKG